MSTTADLAASRALQAWVIACEDLEVKPSPDALLHLSYRVTDLLEAVRRLNMREDDVRNAIEDLARRITDA